jgi:hypothetical protein
MYTPHSILQWVVSSAPNSFVLHGIAWQRHADFGGELVLVGGVHILPPI